MFTFENLLLIGLSVFSVVGLIYALLSLMYLYKCEELRKKDRELEELSEKCKNLTRENIKFKIREGLY